MPFISLVVPVYQVEAYLRVCLDSILGQPFTDLELIAVDDRSPDRSGAILDEYAARDARVKVVHLDRNIGLGPARNAGFDAATGDYVWFVDSDDWLAEGALAGVAQRLEAAKPDVLVVDYARAYPGTRRERNVNAHILEDAPDTFDINGFPPLLDNFVAAWNKVVRTDFLRETGLRFPPGWYEDIPFTYPLLTRANRISTLPEVCVLYRQRRHGHILGTTSARHTQVFDQYELALSRIDNPLVRRHVARAAVDHGSTILGIPGRLPPKARKPFFQRLKAFGFRYGGFRPGIRDRLLSRGAWRTYWFLKQLHAYRPSNPLPSASAVRRLPWLAY